MVPSESSGAVPTNASAEVIKVHETEVEVRVGIGQGSWLLRVPLDEPR